MKTFHFLRVASVVTLLYGAGHTSGVPWTPYTDTEATSVLETMKTHRFAAQGFSGTYWDLHIGFGIEISLVLFLLGVVLWQVASLAKADAARVRPIVVSFLVAFVVNGVLAWKYFFVVPVVMSGVVVGCLGMAVMMAGRGRTAAVADSSNGPSPAG